MSNLLSSSLSLSEQAPCSISSLVDLALFSDDARKASQAASAALDTATRGAFNAAAAAALSHMRQGAGYDDALALVAASLSREAYDAVMIHASGLDDLQAYVRKAQKLSSRVMACAVAVVAASLENVTASVKGEPVPVSSLKINSLEKIAAHVRKGFTLSSLPSLVGHMARLETVGAVVVTAEESELDKANARIAELEALVADYRASLDSLMHGNSVVTVGNTSRRRGKAKTELAAAVAEAA